MLRWWRARRRRRVLSDPFPEEWRRTLDRDVRLWLAVPEADRGKLEDDIRVFVAERSWEPCGGLRLTGSMKAVIAAQACLLTLGRSVDAFDHVRSILVYPETFRAPDVWEDEAGVVTEELDAREGEAWQWGTVVLSWRELLRDSRSLGGRNLVLHELAHQLDLLDVLSTSVATTREQSELRSTWRETFLDAFEEFTSLVDAGRRVKVLDAYGAEDEAEFFAVATESFFERGALLKTHHPGLYDLLATWYRQDPASWSLPRSGAAVPGETARQRRRRRRAEERARRKGR